MLNGRSFFRVSAVFTSLLLVSAYIFYRAVGAEPPTSRAIFPSSKSGRVAPASTRHSDAVLPGSKSFMLLPSSTLPAEVPATRQAARERALFYGSKSAPVALPHDLEPGTVQPTANLQTSSHTTTVPATQPKP